MAVGLPLHLFAYADGEPRCSDSPNWHAAEGHNAWFQHTVVVKPTGEEVAYDSLPESTELETDGLVTRKVLEPGSVVRSDLFICTLDYPNPDAGREMQGRTTFNPGPSSANPKWYSEDRVYIDRDVPWKVTTVFQAAPEPGVQFSLIPEIKWGEGDDTGGNHFTATDNTLKFKVDPTGTEVKVVHKPGPPAAPDCSPPPADLAAPGRSYHVEINNVHAGAPNGQELHSGATVDKGTLIVGSVWACTTGPTVPARSVRQAVQFTPVDVNWDVLHLGTDPRIERTGALQVVPWQDAPFNKNDLTTNINESKRNTLFYQWAPAVPGIYEFYPRITGDPSPAKPGPDDNVAAEGQGFVFCVGPLPAGVTCADSDG